jgi:hypothetical protein
MKTTTREMFSASETAGHSCQARRCAAGCRHGRTCFRLHALKGELDGFYAVTVRANWRVVFRFADGDAFDVDYVDYH